MKILPNNKQCDLFFTNAPQAYDYPYTKELSSGICEYGMGTVRIVSIPAERRDYQFGRYSSGLWIYYPVDNVTDDRLREAIQATIPECFVPSWCERKCETDLHAKNICRCEEEE